MRLTIFTKLRHSPIQQVPLQPCTNVRRVSQRQAPSPGAQILDGNANLRYAGDVKQGNQDQDRFAENEPDAALLELAPADVYDPVIEEYKKGIDMTLILEGLKLTPEQRAVRMQAAIDSLDEIRRARGFTPAD
jgi:hypothetical protein